MFDQNSAHVGVYQVLDGVLANSSVPPGAKGAMFTFIDRLRSNGAPTGCLSKAEQISIELHKLEVALVGSDGRGAQQARDTLKALARAWIDTRIADRPEAPTLGDL